MDASERRSELAATTLTVELQESRSEALAAHTDDLRAWHEGRATGLERALSILDQLGRTAPRSYQRRA